MSPATQEFISLVERYNERGTERPVPEYAKLVISKDNYAYFSHLGKAEAMNYSASIFLINDDVRALYVIYDPDDGKNKQRRYLAKTLDTTIDVGDFVVMPSTVGHNLSVAKVVDVNGDVDFDSTTAIPWVIQKIDMAEFNETVKQEEVAIDRIKAADFAKRRRTLADTLMSAKKMKSLPLSKRRG